MGQRLSISPETLRDVLAAEGLTNEEIRNLLAISRGESGYFFNAVNQDAGSGDDSWGLFQINFRRPAGGKSRANQLGIPISTAFDGEKNLPSTKALADYFLLEKRDGEWLVQDGVTEEELIKRNLDALAIMWTNMPNVRNSDRPFKPWSVHPDSKAYRDASAKGATAHERKWKEDSTFVDERFSNLLGEGEATLSSTGPSEREIQLENEFDANKGNPFRQRQIINEILIERNREGYPNPPVDSVSSAEETAIEQGLLNDEPRNIGDPQRVINPEYTQDYEFLRGNPDAEVEFAGQTFNIVDLIEAERDRELGDLVDPSFYFDPSNPRYDVWVQGLYEQTQHYAKSAQGRADRENNWFKSGEGDELTDRRLDLIEDTVTRVEQLFDDAGIVATETEILEFARDAWLAGWSDDAIRDELSDREDMEFGTDVALASEINANRQDIQSKYRQYLVDPDPDVISEQNRRLWRGETTLENIEAGLASQSADLYPAFADRIEAGRTPLDILSSYSSIFRGVMGYSPEWDGAHMSMGVDMLKDGNITGANFATFLRSTDEYDMTPNAINNAYRLIGTIGETMGVMP